MGGREDHNGTARQSRPVKSQDCTLLSHCCHTADKVQHSTHRNGHTEPEANISLSTLRISTRLKNQYVDTCTYVDTDIQHRNI